MNQQTNKNSNIMKNSANTIEKEIVYHDDLYVWQVATAKKNVMNSLFTTMTKKYNELTSSYDAPQKAGMLEVMKSIKHPQYKELQKEFDATYEFRMLQKEGLLTK